MPKINKYLGKIGDKAKKQFEKHTDVYAKKKVRAAFEKGGEFIIVKPSEILEDYTFQIRSKEVSREDFENLKESIKKHGQQVPVFIRPKDGKYQLIAGFTRYRALKESGREIKAICNDVSDEDAFIIAEIENLQRMEMEFEDVYKHIKKLETEQNLKPAEIAKRLDLSYRSVRNYLNVGGDEDLKKLIEMGMTFKEGIRTLNLPEKEQKKRIRQLYNIFSKPVEERKAAKKKMLKDGDIILNREKNIIKIVIYGKLSEKSGVIKRLEDAIERIKKA